MENFIAKKMNKTEKTFQSKPPDKERLIFELFKKEITFIKEKKTETFITILDYVV